MNSELISRIIRYLEDHDFDIDERLFDYCDEELLTLYEFWNDGSPFNTIMSCVVDDIRDGKKR